ANLREARFDPYGYPPNLVNGKVTIKIYDAKFTGLGTRLRTDAAEEQGRISFIDLPYAFTKIGPKSVGQIDLGGQLFADEAPVTQPAFLASAPPAPAAGPPAYTTTLTYSDPVNKIGTVTFTPAVLTGQTLRITMDPETG